MLIDTHTHPYLEEFASPEREIDRAKEAGVELCILPNVDAKTLPSLLKLHKVRPDNTRIAIGLHPTEVDDTDPLDQINFVGKALAENPDAVAIGEIGMDLYWDKTHRERQMQVLELQLNLASSLQLPAIIHCREALDETLEVISGMKDIPPMVFHSFGGTEADVERIRQVVPEALFGINGVVTFKNCHVRDTLPAIGLEKLLLETDAPYLAPVPMRGRTNTPAYLPLVATHIATSLSVTIEEVANATTDNARRLFRL